MKKKNKCLRPKIKDTEILNGKTCNWRLATKIKVESFLVVSLFLNFYSKKQIFTPTIFSLLFFPSEKVASFQYK